MSLFTLQFITNWSNAQRRVGFSLGVVAGGVVVGTVTPNAPAAQAGLQVGDLIQRVNGRVIAGFTDYDQVASQYHPGQIVSIEILREGKKLNINLKPGVAFPYLDFIVTLITAVGFFVIGLFALHKRASDLPAKILFGFTLAVCLELALPFGFIGSSLADTILRCCGSLLGGIQIGLELHLVTIIPERRRWLERMPWLIPTCYGVGIVTALATCIGYIGEGYFDRQLAPWSVEQVLYFNNNIIIPVWATGVLLIIGSAAVYGLRYRDRAQAKLVTLGVLPWWILVISTTLMDVGGIAQPAWISSIWAPALLMFPGAVLVAMYRYSLFNIDFVVRRGMIYGTLTGALLLFFYAALGAGGALISGVVGGGMTSVWLLSAATLILGLLFAPLRKIVQHFIDRRFFPEREELRQNLINLARELPSLGQLPLMGKHLINRLCEIFAVDSATLLVADPATGVLVTLASTSPAFEKDFDQSFLLAPDDPGVMHIRRAARPVPTTQLVSQSASLHQRLRFFGAALVTPLLSHRELVGLLLLGRKHRSEQFSAEECELLNLFAHHVATIFENARLFESATYEGLTGLLRREAVLAQLEREVERARRYGRPLCVGMVDLDHFKDVNDTYGHLVGDAVLKRVAQTLSSGLRASDTIGRYGGEEFLFLLPETDLFGAFAVAEKIRGAVDGVRVIVDEETFAEVTVSIGLASVDQLETECVSLATGLLTLADANLLQAKRTGRNRVVMSQPATPSAPINPY